MPQLTCGRAVMVGRCSDGPRTARASIWPLWLTVLLERLDCPRHGLFSAGRFKQCLGRGLFVNHQVSASRAKGDHHRKGVVLSLPVLWASAETQAGVAGEGIEAAERAVPRRVDEGFHDGRHPGRRGGSGPVVPIRCGTCPTVPRRLGQVVGLTLWFHGLSPSEVRAARYRAGGEVSVSGQTLGRSREPSWQRCHRGVTSHTHRR